MRGSQKILNHFWDKSVDILRLLYLEIFTQYLSDDIEAWLDISCTLGFGINVGSGISIEKGRYARNNKRRVWNNCRGRNNVMVNVWVRKSCNKLWKCRFLLKSDDLLYLNIYCSLFLHETFHSLPPSFDHQYGLNCSSKNAVFGVYG